MHSHAVKGSKLQRTRDQRRMLVKNLANSLILEESITTTAVKAKHLRPYVEKLITKAKKGTLHSRRQVISGLTTIEAAHKLCDEIAPKLSKRNSGFLRIVVEDNRRGDFAPMATIEFVDDLSAKAPKKTASKDKKDVISERPNKLKTAEKTSKKPASKKESKS